MIQTARCTSLETVSLSGECAAAQPGSTGGRRRARARASAGGFTMIELIVIVGIVSVLMVATTLVMPSMIKQARADGSLDLVTNTFRLARDRAIGERRNMSLVFIDPDRIQVWREEIVPITVPVTPPASTLLNDVFLEGGQKFQYFTPTGDTGDLFGLVNKPLAFGPTQGVVIPVMFTSEGTFVNSAGDPINATLFFGTPNDSSSARAVTIFGPTALVRAWKWNGAKWTE